MLQNVFHSLNFLFLFEISSNAFACVVLVLLVLCAAKMFSIPWIDSDYNCHDQTKSCLFPIDYVLSITTLANGLSEHLNGTGDGRPIDLVIIVGLIMIKKIKKNNWPRWFCQNAVANRDKPVDSLGKKSQLIRRLIHLRPVYKELKTFQIDENWKWIDQ